MIISWSLCDVSEAFWKIINFINLGQVKAAAVICCVLVGRISCLWYFSLARSTPPEANVFHHSAYVLCLLPRLHNRYNTHYQSSCPLHYLFSILTSVNQLRACCDLDLSQFKRPESLKDLKNDECIESTSSIWISCWQGKFEVGCPAGATVRRVFRSRTI